MLQKNFFFVNPGEMYFALTSPPGSRVSVGHNRSYYPAKISGSTPFPGGRGARESFNLHFRLNPFLSQNHQVHTRGTSRYFPFLPSERQSRVATIVPVSSAESANFRKERDDRSSLFLSHRSSAFSLSRIKYPISPPRTRVSASPMPRKGSRSFGRYRSVLVWTS